MQDQASKLKSSQVVAVISGKGGVGKTLIATNMAATLADTGRKVLVLDADIGFTNADILLGAFPKFSIKDFVNRACSIDDLVTHTNYGVDLVSLGGDVSDVLAVSDLVLKDFTTHFLKLLDNYEIVVMDMPPGFSEAYMPFLALVDDFIIMSTVEPTSIVNTYTIVKLLSIKGIGGESIHLVANMVQDVKEATKLMSRFSEVVERFVNNRVSSVTIIKDHPLVERSIHDRELFVKKYRNIQPSFSVTRLVSILLKASNNPKDQERVLEKFLNLFRGVAR
ncbi:MAG TPA: MinD/ParA family protein [Fervidobacterium sp.]|nr:MinD/ParA family protein [Fervidobacterium sp.]HUM75684.1 P-loop NTPase [Fervidobacterium sp.]